MPSKSPLKDFESLRQLRDELKLQAHLFKGEVADEWKNLEKEMKLLIKTQSEPIKAAARNSAKEVKGASKRVIGNLKQGYEQLKKSLQ